MSIEYSITLCPTCKKPPWQRIDNCGCCKGKNVDFLLENSTIGAEPEDNPPKKFLRSEVLVK